MSESIFLYAFTVEEPDATYRLREGEQERDETLSTKIRIYGLTRSNKTVCLKICDFYPRVWVELPQTDFKWERQDAEIVALKILERMSPRNYVAWGFRYRAKLYSPRSQKVPFLLIDFPLKSDIYVLRKILQKPLLCALGHLKLKVHGEAAGVVLQLTTQLGITPSSWIDFQGHRVHRDDRETRADLEYDLLPDGREQGWQKIVHNVDEETPASPLILSFDLEVYSSVEGRMPTASEPGDEIFQISCVLFRRESSEDEREEYLLTLGATPSPTRVGANVLRFSCEGALIEGFANFIQEHRPNIITGYNIMGFDIPYLTERAKLVGEIDQLSQAHFNDVKAAPERKIRWSSQAYKNQEFQFLDWEGIIVIDMLKVIQRDYRLSNYKLDTVAQHILGEQNQKDPLTYKDIFDCYRRGVKSMRDDGTYPKSATRAIELVGKYCMVDSRLVANLFVATQTFIGYSEMAKTCMVPVSDLILRGQQLKVFSAVFRHCHDHGIVVESNGYVAGENETYVGAYVFQPVPGVYENVAPFDFASLYPTTMIAYNIDYSTLVKSRRVPDRQCHIVEWQDHIGCEHDPRVKERTALTRAIDELVEQTKYGRERAKKLLVKDFIPSGRRGAAIRRKATNARNRARQKIHREIAEIEVEIKKLREKRVAIVKSIPKNKTCAHHRYRWLKKPRGVLPTILQNLLDARARTRREIKSLRRAVDDCDDPRTRLEAELLISVLDKRQLSYKVSANSMYGACGVREGYLPFMPGAMCTTALGRRNNKLAAKTIVDKWKGKLIYGDSVSGDTPVLVRQDGLIHIVTIDSLGNDAWTDFPLFKAGQSNRRDKQQSQSTNVEVWSNGMWSPIKRVIRHRTKKKMFRVLTHTGCVDVTEDHSLCDATGNKLKPEDAFVGQELLHAWPECDLSGVLDPDEAFVFGFFFGNGSCGDYNCPSGRKRSWALNNSNMACLQEVKSKLEACEPELSWKILDTLESSGAYKLVPTGRDKSIVAKYLKLFYDDRKHKKVPSCVLNATRHARIEFVRGYRLADGAKNGPQRCDCKGKIGTQGLYFLFRSLGENVSINTRESKPHIYRLNSTYGTLRQNPRAIKKIIDLGYCDENEFVYDIETASGKFAAGVGSMVVFNTDSEYVTFPHIVKTGSSAEHAKALWDYCETVADDVTRLFMRPMRLEFEDEIYAKFVILSKKRYIYRKMLKSGEIKRALGKKGVLLTRRDNCEVVRSSYAEIVDMVFENRSVNDILNFLTARVCEIMSGRIRDDDFVITKAVGSVGDLPTIVEYLADGSWKPAVNDKGKAIIGNYTIPLLSSDPVERARQLKLKDATDEISYYTNSLPAVVTLAIKMRSRGTRVEPGTRLEYVVTVGEGHRAKQFQKIEDFDYFKRHRRVLRLDYLYYVKSMVNSFDQLLKCCCGDEVRSFTASLYKRMLQREKLLREIRPATTIIFQ